MHASPLNWTKLLDRLQSSQNNLFGQYNHTEVYLLILILSQSYHINSWLAISNMYYMYCVIYMYCVAEATTLVAITILFISSRLFFLHCMINILRQMKTFLVKLMNRLSCLITQSINWYDGLKRVMNPFFLSRYSHFSGENCSWSSCLLFITEWISLDIFDEITFWTTLSYSMLCWDWFIYWWYTTTSL